MPILQLVATQGIRCDGPIRFRYLPAGSQVEVSQPNTPMQQVPASNPGSHASTGRVAKETQRTTLVLELDHAGDLPADLADKIGQRIYDFCSTKGVTVSPTVRVWYELKVREQS